ncbi:MAG: hypothetical protein IJ574_00540 [Bacilli bacterium]|nr:hypothetical protein [Bacilli bacterium]
MRDSIELTFGQLNELCINRKRFIDLLEINGISNQIRNNKAFYSIINNIQSKLKGNVLNRALQKDSMNQVITNCYIEQNAISIKISANQNRVINSIIYDIISMYKLTINLFNDRIEVYTHLDTDNIETKHFQNIPEYKSKVIEKSIYNFLEDGTANYINYWANENIKENNNQYYGIVTTSKYDEFGIEYEYEEMKTNIENIDSPSFLSDNTIYKYIEETLENNNIQTKYHNQRIGINLMQIDIEEYYHNKKYDKHFTNTIDYNKPLKNLEILYEPKYYNIMVNNLDSNTLNNILKEPQNEFYEEGLLRYEKEQY